MADAPNEQRKLAAIMFTDMVGYSALAQKNEALALELLEEHRKLVRPLFTKHGGREIKTIGDAFMVEFVSPVEAARCAIAMQRTLHKHNESAAQERQVRIRIGLHLGDVIHRDGDVYGDGVNIAARIEPLADPGGICLTQQIYDHVHNKLDAPLVKLGDKELKNIQVPVCLYRVVMPWEINRLTVSKRVRFQWRPKQRRLAAALFLVLIGLSVWQWSSHKARRPSVGRIESLAVLPLVNLSNDPAQEYFPNGITELLTTELGKISALSVSSVQAVMQYKKAGTPLAKMLEELKVDAWVEGSILRDGQRVGITARLIQASTGKQLWQTNSTRNLSNIVDLQGEVALALAEAMKAKLLPAERTLLSAPRPVHPEAMEFYLRGKFAFGERTDEAIAMLEQAIKLDPKFALAHAQLAYAYAAKGYFTDPVAKDKAHQVLEQAISLNPNLPEICMVRARLLFNRANRWDVEQAMAQTQKALELNPSLDEPYVFRATIRWHVGLLDKLIPDYEKGLALNPNHPWARSEIGGYYLMQTNYEKALYYMTNFPGRFPVPIAENGLAMTYQHLHRTNEAWSVLSKYLDSGRPDTGGLIGSAQAVLLAEAGHKTQALEKIAQAQTRGQNFGHFHHTTYNIAAAYALMNEPAQAMRWLRQTAEDGYPNYVWFQRDPNLDSLRGRPEFVQFMAELEKQWLSFRERL